MNHRSIGRMFEGIIESLYCQILQPGDTAIDVGAHKGRHTEAMVNAVGADGRVLAFEPISALAESLEQRARAAGLERTVEVHNVALADRAGRREFHVVANDMAYSGLRVKRYPFKAELEMVSVEVRVLDDYLREGPRPGFVKIDVEGGEFDVLKGMRDSLENHRPVVAFECGKGSASEAYGYSKEEFFALFDQVGYCLRDVLGCPFLVEAWAVVQPWNVIAYPVEASASVVQAHSLAIAENLIGFTWE